MFDKEKERKLADDRLALFAQRYQGASNDFFPLVIAKEWRDMLAAVYLDLDLMKQILERATVRKDDFDLAFFAFCNDMEETHRNALKSGLEEQR